MLGYRFDTGPVHRHTDLRARSGYPVSQRRAIVETHHDRQRVTELEVAQESGGDARLERRVPPVVMRFLPCDHDLPGIDAALEFEMDGGCFIQASLEPQHDSVMG